jgi:conjugative relaxase-like TrwC/TraI family protein
MSRGKAMANHLLEQTLPAKAAELARYYQNGLSALSPEERGLRQLARAVASGTLDFEVAVGSLLELTKQQPAPVLAAADAHTEREETAREEVRYRLFSAIEEYDAASERQQQMAEARLQAAVDSYKRGTAEEPTTGEPRRDMHPRIAELLAIDPHRAVSGDELANLLSGLRADRKPINGAAKNKVISFVDCCFSADKSVSLAWAFAPTEAERNQIMQAHRDAVEAAMKYVSVELGRARKGAGGRHGAEPGHVAWVKFDHYTSRPTLEVADGDHTELVTMKVAGDPNLHTHVALMNVVLTERGRVGSLDLRRLEGRVHEFGAYYQAHLAQNLREVGADMALDLETGAGQLTPIPREVRDAFSKRTLTAEQIARKWATENGQDWDHLAPAERIELAKRGASQGRKSKDARTDDLSDFVAWHKQAEAIGWKHEGALAAGPAPERASREARLEKAYAAALPFVERGFGRAAVVEMAEIRVAATRGLIAAGVDGPEDITAVVAKMGESGVQQDGAETRLIAGNEGRRVRVTTERHVGREEELVALAHAAGADRSAALTPDAIERAVKRSRMDFGDAHGQQQRAIIERLGTGGRLGVAIGIAGAGKTTLLAPLVDAWQQDGRTVFGAAVAWRQTDDLADIGIKPDHRFALSVLLDRAEAGQLHLDRKSVVVVDELGTVGTTNMARLLKLQSAAGAQVVAVGDPLQCQSIEAGPVIDLMRRALGAEQVPELLSTVRQQTARERETSTMFREGRAAEALDRKQADGTLLIVPGAHRDAIERVADLWAERHQVHAADPDYRLTISAPTNADARAIGAAIRERRRATGQLGPDKMTLPAIDQLGATYELPLAVGDRVRLFANTSASRHGRRATLGRNGSVLDVLGVEANGVTLRNARGTEGKVAWTTLADRETGRIRLTYGDALTISSSQGVTSSEHIDAMPSGTKAVNAFAAYVAESRHWRASYLVTSDGAEPPQDVLANMARNLSRQPEKASALAFMEAAGEQIRVGARGFQRGLRPAEERERAGLASTTLHRTFARHRLRAAAARLQEFGRRIKPAIEATTAALTGRNKEATMSDTNRKDDAYLERLRQRAQQAQQEVHQAGRGRTDNAYLASLQLRAQQAQQDEREAKQVAQRQVSKQRRGLRM